MAQNNGIIGGAEIDITDAPWQVSIGQLEGLDYQHFCGGVIISDEIIVTAAHCVGERLTHIHAGSTDAEDILQGQLIEVLSVEVDPRFTGDAEDGYDVAVIKLAEPLCLNGVTTRAISYAESGNFVDEPAFITGWGDSGNGTSANQLRGATLPIIDNAVATTYYPDSSSNCSEDIDLEKDFYLSLFEAGSGIASGFNDSGGPAVIFQNNEPLLVGISSFGCHPRELNPSIFADVAFHSDFIESQISDDFPDPIPLTSPLSGTYNDGPYFITGAVEVIGDLDLSGIVFMESGSSLEVTSGNINVQDAEFRSCGGRWNGITLGRDVTGQFNGVRISNADTGINTEARIFKFIDVAIRDCNLGMEATLNNIGFSEVNLEFVRFIDAPVICNSSTIRFLGCKFSNSELEFNDCRVFIDEVFLTGNAITPIRCGFYNSPTVYNSGNHYGVSFALYDRSSQVMIKNCEYVNICWSFFDGHSKASIALENVVRHDIFGNIFESLIALFISEGFSSFERPSQFRNNICIDQSFSVNSREDFFVEYWCNHHDDVSAFVYKTPEGQEDQGEPGHPAGNIFTNTELDISNSDGFTYYWDEFNVATFPKVENLTGFDIVETSFDQEDRCRTREFIENVWDGELCNPSTFWEGDECFDTCGWCPGCEIEIPTEGDGGSTGKIDISSEGGQVFSDSYDKEHAEVSKIYQTSEAIHITLNYEEIQKVSLYNNLGQIIFNKDLSPGENIFNYNEIPAGLYTLIVYDNILGVSNTKQILIP